MAFFEQAGKEKINIGCGCPNKPREWVDADVYFSRCGVNGVKLFYRGSELLRAERFQYRLKPNGKEIVVARHEINEAQAKKIVEPCNVVFPF